MHREDSGAADAFRGRIGDSGEASQIADFYLFESVEARSGADHVRCQGYRVVLRRPGPDFELILKASRACLYSLRSQDITDTAHKPPRSLPSTV